MTRRQTTPCSEAESEVRELLRRYGEDIAGSPVELAMTSASSTARPAARSRRSAIAAAAAVAAFTVVGVGDGVGVGVDGGPADEVVEASADDSTPSEEAVSVPVVQPARFEDRLVVLADDELQLLDGGGEVLRSQPLDRTIGFEPFLIAATSSTAAVAHGPFLSLVDLASGATTEHTAWAYGPQTGGSVWLAMTLLPDDFDPTAEPTSERSVEWRRLDLDTGELVGPPLPGSINDAAVVEISDSSLLVLDRTTGRYVALSPGQGGQRTPIDVGAGSVVLASTGAELIDLGPDGSVGAQTISDPGQRRLLDEVGPAVPSFGPNPPAALSPDLSRIAIATKDAPRSDASHRITILGLAGSAQEASSFDVDGEVGAIAWDTTGQVVVVTILEASGRTVVELIDVGASSSTSLRLEPGSGHSAVPVPT